jgi:hypothetical protein
MSLEQAIYRANMTATALAMPHENAHDLRMPTGSRSRIPVPMPNLCHRLAGVNSDDAALPPAPLLLRIE